VGICFLSEDAAGSVQEHLIGEEPLHVIVLLAAELLCEKAVSSSINLISIFALYFSALLERIEAC
jgi:hypothetical protein